jgi:hypothetical protein
LPQLIAGASFFVLILAITHEFAYYQIVGSEFQSLMSATDYLVSSLSWLPLFVVITFAGVVGVLALIRWSGGRPHSEMRETSKPYRRLSHVMELLFGSGTAIATAVVVVLFGNPYDLRLIGGLISVSSVAFVVWLAKTEIFRSVITLPVYIIAPGAFVFVALAFVYGRWDGYHDLTRPVNVHTLKVKDNSTEVVKFVVLRLLTAGVLVRKLDEQRIQFYRWDQIETLSREFGPLDSRSVVCRLLKWDCPTIPAAPPKPTPAPEPPASSPETVH